MCAVVCVVSDDTMRRREEAVTLEAVTLLVVPLLLVFLRIPLNPGCTPPPPSPYHMRTGHGQVTVHRPCPPFLCEDLPAPIPPPSPRKAVPVVAGSRAQQQQRIGGGGSSGSPPRKACPRRGSHWGRCASSLCFLFCSITPPGQCGPASTSPATANGCVCGYV